MRYRLHLLARREERVLRRRMARLLATGAPEPDEPIELAPERVCPRTGELLDRRRVVRRPPTIR
jgi:hypothetical protein